MQVTQSRPRRRDREVDGILLLDKAIGVSFERCAAEGAPVCSRRKKAGQRSTLDPLASGMLIACFGQATKVLDVCWTRRRPIESRSGWVSPLPR